MIIDCISDLHGNYPKLEGGDLLIIGGDLTKRDENMEYDELFNWLDYLPYKEIILIAGNHDNKIQEGIAVFDDVKYLCDSGTEFEGLKIWGSPWTKTFKGMNKKCMAFTFDKEEDLANKFDLIPDDIDILITHSPPYGILDECAQGDYIINVGSPSLRGRLEKCRPKYHIFGHIHEHGGQQVLLKHIGPNTLCINASHVDEWYRPINKPVRIEV